MTLWLFRLLVATDDAPASVPILWRAVMASHVVWRARQVFAAIDKDGNGTLSYEEFGAAVSRLPLDPPFTAKEIADVIEVLDSNW